MKIMTGDLIELMHQGKFDVVFHVCNCHHVMGGGIAKQLKENFPEVYIADKQTKYRDIEKLGTYSTANVTTKNGLVIVLNLYAQFDYGTHKRQLNYEALVKCLEEVKQQCSDSKLRFGFPKIGAGLAGGNWNIIKTIITECLYDEDLTLVIYKD